MSEPTRVTEPLALTWVHFADVIDTVTTDGVVEPHFVMHGCDAAMKGYYCVSDRTQLANVGSLVLHLESGGAHQIAVWCNRHRVYESPEPSQVAGFEQALGRRGTP